MNADDWGYDGATTSATVACFEAGLISSATGMVFMADSARAAALARGAGLPVGLHLNLSEPFSDPGVPAAVKERQARLVEFFTEHFRVRRWTYAFSARGQVERCIADQLEQFEALYGRPPTHVDGHQHVHVCPNVFMARTIPTGTKMRNVLDSYPGRKSPAAIARALRRSLASRRFPSTRYFFDIRAVHSRFAGGSAERGWTLASTGDAEVMCHPGMPEELELLMSDEWAERLRGRRLGSFADLPAR